MKYRSSVGIEVEECLYLLYLNIKIEKKHRH